MNLIATRELAQVTGLKDWEIWRAVKDGQLNPHRLPNGQFLWNAFEVERAFRLAAKRGRRGTK